MSTCRRSRLLGIRQGCVTEIFCFPHNEANRFLPGTATLLYILVKDILVTTVHVHSLHMFFRAKGDRSGWQGCKKLLSSFSFATSIFIGSQASSKYLCPLSSMYPERQIIIVAEWQRSKWKFHLQRLTLIGLGNSKTATEKKREKKKKENGSTVNESG